MYYVVTGPWLVRQIRASKRGGASQQLWFSINKGCWGLTSLDLTLSSALCGGLGSFVKWYGLFLALEKGCGACRRFFLPPTGGDGLTHVAESVQTSLDALVKYGITVADQPDKERFVILSLAGMAEHFPPGQHAVFHRCSPFICFIS